MTHFVVVILLSLTTNTGNYIMSLIKNPTKIIVITKAEDTESNSVIAIHTYSVATKKIKVDIIECSSDDDLENIFKGKIKPAVKFLNFTSINITREQVTPEFMNRIFELSAFAVDALLGSRCHAQYYAFALSIANADVEYIAVESFDIQDEYCKTRCYLDDVFAPSDVFDFSDKTEAFNKIRDFNGIFDIGSRNFSGGEIFRNGRIVGALSANLSLNDCAGWCGMESNRIDKTLTDEQAESFLARYKSFKG